jgi:hypothetical protein
MADDMQRKRRQDCTCLCVPKTLSTSCDQAVFVDEAAGVSLSADTVPLEIDRLR